MQQLKGIAPRLALVLIALSAPEMSGQGSAVLAEINRDIAGKPLPKLENGVLCGIDINERRIYAVHASGAPIFDVVIKIRDASIVVLSACAVSPSGTFAASGSAVDSSGRAATFISFLDHSGRTLKIQQLDNLAVARMSFDATGKLWVAGCIPGYNLKKGAPQDILVRGFALDGSIVKAVDIPYSFDPSFHNRPVVNSLMALSDQELVILVPQRNHLIFVSLNSGIVRAHHFRPPDELKLISGFGLSKSNGGIYMSAILNLPSGSEQASFFRWDKVSTTWKQVAMESAGTTKPYAILGVEADRLLTTSSKAKLLWNAVPAN